jgi:hypothetical protein
MYIDHPARRSYNWGLISRVRQRTPTSKMAAPTIWFSVRGCRHYRPEKINECDPVTRIRHECGFLFIISTTHHKIRTFKALLKPQCIRCSHTSRLMTSVHSKLVQSRQHTLLKTTSQRHCISNVRHDMPWRRNVDLLVPAVHNHSAGLNAVWL